MAHRIVVNPVRSLSFAALELAVPQALKKRRGVSHLGENNMDSESRLQHTMRNQCIA